MIEPLAGLSRSSKIVCLLLLISGNALIAEVTTGDRTRGIQFMGFDRFSSFEQVAGTNGASIILTSPVMPTLLLWDELIVSWNVKLGPESRLKAEARGFAAKRATKWYVLGIWSTNPGKFTPESVPGQEDETGDVATDTLVLKARHDEVQVRFTLYNSGEPSALKFVGLCLTDSTYCPPAVPADRTARGCELPVPQISQMVFPNGNVICSPTTVAMLMDFWSFQLGRPELSRPVPEIANFVYDKNWGGTGNWAFNMAYAGQWQGIRAYVTRMSGLSELERWVEAGMPVGLSVCYDRLRGKTDGSNGHLVVCVGFTEQGDVIINDPGTSQNVRRVFPRTCVANAWAHSRNTAYLVYPEKMATPEDQFGHWHSRTSERNLRRKR